MIKDITLQALGIIHTPHNKVEGMPIQPAGAKGIKGEVIIQEKYRNGPKDLDGFSHIMLIYLFHKIKDYKLELIPFMDTVSRGIFATRSPKRPNRIGISIVRLIKIQHTSIYFDGADMLNETPLLDIKPFFGIFDNQTEVKSGWLDYVGEMDIQNKKSDQRFKY